MSDLDVIGANDFTKTIADADQYYSPENHSRSVDWFAYNVAARKGAFEQAKRELVSYLGRYLEDPETDEPCERDDWGAYEQALEILDRQPRQTVGSKVKNVGAQKEDERRGFRISPIALSYLRVPRLRIARG